MARYDDDRPRRRDDDDYDDYPHRPSDTARARRDSLMDRRLRHARGEGDDDFFDEEEYAPPPRSSRARSSPLPSYNSSGCANVLLYVILGGIAVVVVFLLAGQQLLKSFVPNVPQQIRQVVATPTTTIRDRGGTIVQIRSLNRLETQSFSVERVVEAKVERGNPLDLVLGDRLLLIASGEVVARVSAEAEILNAACEGNVMQKAADDAQRSMEQFLRLLDFERVTVTSSAGPCVAPVGGAPAAGTPTTP